MILKGVPVRLRNFRGSHVESLEHYIYRKTLRPLRGVPVKRNTLYYISGSHGSICSCILSSAAGECRTETLCPDVKSKLAHWPNSLGLDNVRKLPISVVLLSPNKLLDDPRVDGRFSAC